MLSLNELKKLMDELSKERKLFHSEADFQHALSYLIHKKYPNTQIRLEKKISEFYIDIIIHDKITIGIELKYKTKKFNYSELGEQFDLKSVNAHNFACLYFRKDISRLETLKNSKKINKGFVIFLTNDSNYFNKNSSSKQPIYENIKIYDNNKIKKKVDWLGSSESKNSISKQNIPDLKNEYICNWNQYSKCDDEEFKYLLLEI